MDDPAEAGKWLGYETYGLDGAMEIAAAMGLVPRRERSAPNPQRFSWLQQTPRPILFARRAVMPSDTATTFPSPQLAATKRECIEKCGQILERPLPAPGRDVNTWDFHKCVNGVYGFGLVEQIRVSVPWTKALHVR